MEAIYTIWRQYIQDGGNMLRSEMKKHINFLWYRTKK
jgi:hypothetical protein